MAEKFVLSSGLRVVVEQIPHLHSVSAGLWVDTGSVYETPELAGASHFLEHLLFKGTKKRSALDISLALEGKGGVLNAFTGKEHTCFYFRALDEDFDLGLELLSDMYHNSLLEPSEVERERQVIIEEINMYEDSPDDLVAEKFSAALWPEDPYGLSISGTVESVTALTRDALHDYWKANYVPKRTVLAVAGNVEPLHVVELAESLFPAEEGVERPLIAVPKNGKGRIITVKDIEQEHVAMGFAGVSLSDDDAITQSIIVNALGGGSSSRLFQEIREKRGLSYTAYAYGDHYDKCGYVQAYAATQPNKAEELIRVMAEQFGEVLDKGLSEEEISRSKDQIRGGLMLSLENSSSVMSRLGRSELALGELYSPVERVEKLMAVTPDDVDRVIRRLFVRGGLVISQVGASPCEVDAERLF